MAGSLLLPVKAGSSTPITDGTYIGWASQKPISMAVIATPTGVYGVIGSDEFKETSKPISVRVTYIYQSERCDERNCQVLGYKTHILKQGYKGYIGYIFMSNRLILKLDDQEKNLEKQGRMRYGKQYYMTSYDVTVFFSNGQSFKKRLVGLF
ncbi:hypothetical protein [Deinococcus sp.]|uniref:hypothetical protein n=1 Tax=Deinococcus sp. TaxID=47478 RepID=UPI0025F6943B|nr:hypothetical protein [Deinococcus sp.]